MEKSFIESWQESSKSLAGLCKNISDKNVALTQELAGNLASKQFTTMTRTAFQMSHGIKNAGEKGFMDGSALFFPLRILSETSIQSVKELNEIYLAGLEKIRESQTSIWKSYVDLLSSYQDNLNKSRDVNDLVAVNFDLSSNLMMTAKTAALDNLTAAESIKTALVAWSNNSVQAIEDDRPAAIH